MEWKKRAPCLRAKHEVPAWLQTLAKSKRKQAHKMQDELSYDSQIEVPTSVAAC